MTPTLLCKQHAILLLMMIHIPSMVKISLEDMMTLSVIFCDFCNTTTFMDQIFPLNTLRLKTHFGSSKMLLSSDIIDSKYDILLVSGTQSVFKRADEIFTIYI